MRTIEKIRRVQVFQDVSNPYNLVDEYTITIELGKTASVKLLKFRCDWKAEELLYRHIGKRIARQFENFGLKIEFCFHSDLGEKGLGLTSAHGLHTQFTIESEGKWKTFDLYVCNFTDYQINNLCERLNRLGKTFVEVYCYER